MIVGLSILEISKTLMYKFWYGLSNQSIKTMQNYATWIQIAILLLMNNAVFGKTMENVNKHRDLRLVKTDKKRSRLVSKPNYHTTKSFSDGLLAIETQKIKVKMNKPVYLQSVTNYLRLTLVST